MATIGWMIPAPLALCRSLASIDSWKSQQIGTTMNSISPLRKLRPREVTDLSPQPLFWSPSSHDPSAASLD